MRIMSKQYTALGLIILASIIGGGVPTLQKIALREIPPISFTLLRFLVAGAVMLPWYFMARRRRPTTDFRKLVFVSLLATANVALFIFGLERTTATAAQMLYAAVPLIVGLISYFLLRERVSPLKLAGVVVGFVGVLTIILLPKLGGAAVFTGDLIGNLIILVGVVSFAWYSVLCKELQRDYTPSRCRS